MSYVSAAPAPGPAGSPIFPGGFSGLDQTAPKPKLSGGDYGLAMSRVTIPAKAVRLLRLSSTFRKIARALDRAYIDHRRWIALQQKNRLLTLDQDSRVATGRLRGRRILFVSYDPAGSLFIPASSVETLADWDVIRFSPSLQHDPIRAVEAVAHESAHALARVKTRRVPSTPVEQVRAAVLDECRARRIEQRIVAEIRRTKAGRTALAGHPVPHAPRECDCERDWFPAAQKRTYLEQFVLGMDWESAAGKLERSKIEEITAAVAAIPLRKLRSTGKPSLLVAILKGETRIAALTKQFPVLQSPAGQAALVLRVLDESWRQLIRKIGESSGKWPALKELRLKRHARLFFKIKVGYTKCP